MPIYYHTPYSSVSNALNKLTPRFELIVIPLIYVWVSAHVWVQQLLVIAEYDLYILKFIELPQYLYISE
jgi:hypothetical protein